MSDLDPRARELVPRALVRLVGEICVDFEQRYPDAHCSVLVADLEEQRLLHVAAPTLPEGFRRVIDGLPIGEGIGACGTAAARGEVVVVEDALADELTRAFRGMASSYGLRSVWSRPVLSDDGVLRGTFAVYRGTAHRPDEAELAAVGEAVARVRTAMLELCPPTRPGGSAAHR
jgi:GAF domain-containing protein